MKHSALAGFPPTNPKEDSLMFVHDLTYDMDSENDPDYVGLIEALEHLDSIHAFESTWYIFTNLTESEFHQRLQPFFNDGDKWRVGEVRTVGAGRMPKQVWDWLKDRLTKCKRKPSVRSVFRS
jgi:hypothetical protein